MTETLTKPQTAEAEFFDVGDLAAICKCSERHIYRMCDGGKMPQPIRLGALVRWPKRTILDWITAGCKPVRQAVAGKH